MTEGGDACVFFEYKLFYKYARKFFVPFREI